MAEKRPGTAILLHFQCGRMPDRAILLNFSFSGGVEEEFFFIFPLELA